MKKSSLGGGIRRRDFVVLGSAATAGLAASMMYASTGPALDGLAPMRHHLSVGFAPPSSDSQSLRRADEVRGDLDFSSRDARVTVHGLWRPESVRSQPASVSLSVFQTVGDTTVPFLAWNHARTSSAAGVSFRTALDARGTLVIGVERSRPYSLFAVPARRFSRLFRAVPGNVIDLPEQETLAAAGSLCRLHVRRGTYFVALLDTPREPNWNAITARTERNVRSGSALHIGDAPVDFEYLVVSVDRV